MMDSDLQTGAPGQPEQRSSPSMTIDTSAEMSGDDEGMEFDQDDMETVTYDTGEGDVEIVMVPRRR
jgi:hypothetical protein